MPQKSAATTHTRPEPVYHQNVTNDLERRQMLLWLIEEHGGGVTATSKNSKISRVHLEQLLSGKKDLLRMQQETIEKLLTALNLPDTQAWKLLGIPEKDRRRWRTLRPPPMGHGDDPREVVNIVLDGPLGGDISAPAGYMITVDTGNRVSGLIVTRVGTRYYATEPDAVPPSGEVLGQLVALDTATRQG